MKNNELSLLPELTRSKNVVVNFGTTTPTINVKYFFNYDLELKESKTVGVFFNASNKTILTKLIDITPITTVDALNSCYINLVDKDNNVVVENLPLNALFQYLYTQGQLSVSPTAPMVIKKFNVEIDWARSYVVFYATPGTLNGNCVSLQVYYKRKIQK